MKNADELKKMVADKYGAIAEKEGSCCDAECGCETDYSFIGDEYKAMDGYAPDADLGLGCGLPTEYADIKEGQVVVDLGSGAGNDCFVARSIVGPEGKVIGLDFTPAMIDKAEENARNLRYSNVHFVTGDIEKMPLEDHTADVVVSNCVMNLVPNKLKAFQETYRILKPGGHFSISDVVVVGDLPPGVQAAAELYAGCVSGAIQKTDYLKIIEQAGFSNVKIQKDRQITVPDETLTQVLSEKDVAAFKSADVGIFSITVYGEKAEEPCCDSQCCN